ncbi:hypothetical protein CSIM01_07701 [Colletotrichum simmondsii]|uniref:Uncharacterized protein n=1 Tax=Colletotrichum simmondsii TaxID=703756 RepID=A0A135TZU4_9PEZI|nr:hypothetical protein CSIM01_07701 [Colletotrichum simmondsii]
MCRVPFHARLFGPWLAAAAVLVLGQDAADKAKFGDPINVLGSMERTDQDFQDSLALDLFSPKNRTLVVQQNLTPLPGNFVTGTTGGPFMALQNYSYVISLNESANDLIAKIEIPYDPTALAAIGIQESNTYVGTLAGDKRSWIVNDATRNVHREENNTRIIKMTSLQGEYILLGRKTVDTSNEFVQYGQGATRTVNVTAGNRQEAEFIDGLRLSVVPSTDMGINIDIVNGISPQAVPPGLVPVNSFAWVVNSSSPGAPMLADMKFPFNPSMLSAVRGFVQPAPVRVAKKALGTTPEVPFQLMAGEIIGILPDNSVTIPNVTQVDGQKDAGKTLNIETMYAFIHTLLALEFSPFINTTSNPLLLTLPTPSQSNPLSTKRQNNILIRRTNLDLTTPRTNTALPHNSRTTRKPTRDNNLAPLEPVPEHGAQIVPHARAVQVIRVHELRRASVQAVARAGDFEGPAAGGRVPGEGLAVGAAFCGQGSSGADVAADGPEGDFGCAVVYDCCFAEGCGLGCGGEEGDEDGVEMHVGGCGLVCLSGNLVEPGRLRTVSELRSSWF